MHSFKYSSSAKYKVEAHVNMELGITNYDLYKSLEDNTIYAGSNSLSVKRKDQKDLALKGQYRHCKQMEPDKRFTPPTFEPTASETYVDNNHVVVTNILQVALDFFSGY
jgi:hypothetical protein